MISSPSASLLAQAVGTALRPLPPALFQPLLSVLANRLATRHPGMFDRLSAYDGAVCLIDPSDLPFAFALTVRCPPARPSARIVPKDGAARAAAIIRAPLPRLLELLQGRLDGDALFFSRELTVAGDMELIVALRNAVDDAAIDLVADLASACGPLSGVAERAAGHLLRLGGAALRDLARVHDALVAPALQRSDAVEAEVARLREEVAELRRRVAAGKGRASAAPARSG